MEKICQIDKHFFSYKKSRVTFKATITKNFFLEYNFIINIIITIYISKEISMVLDKGADVKYNSL